MTPSNTPGTLNPSSASQIRGVFLFLTLGYIFIFNYVYTCAGA